MSALRSSRTFSGVQLSDLRFKRNSVPVGGGLLSITESGEAVIGGPAVLSSLYVTGLATFGSTAVFLGSSVFTRPSEFSGPTTFGVTATFLDDIVAPSVQLMNIRSADPTIPPFGELTYDGSGLLLNGVEVGSGSGGDIVADSLDVTGSAVFQGSAVFTDMTAFNGPSTFADTATFGGPASFGNAATFACPTLFGVTATFLQDIVAPSVQLTDGTGSVGELTYNGSDLLLNGATIGNGSGGDIIANMLTVNDAAVFSGTAAFGVTATFASDIVVPSVQLRNGSSVGALTYDGSGLLLNGVEVGSGSGGDIVATSLDVSGASVFQGSATFGNAAVFTDMAAFNGPSTFADTATFGGPASFGNAATFACPTLFNDTVTFLDDVIAPSVQLTDSCGSVGALTFNGTDLLLNGTTIGNGSGGDIVANSLDVSGTSVFQGLATFGVTATFAQDIVVSSVHLTSGNADGVLTYDGSGLLLNGIEVGSGGGSGGDIVAASLDVSGTSVFQGSATFESAAVFMDMTAFNGPSTFADTATFGGPASFGNAATFACPTMFNVTSTFLQDIVAPSVQLTDGSGSVGALTYDGSGLLLNGVEIGAIGPQGPIGPQGTDGSGSAINWSTFNASSNVDLSGYSIVSSGDIGIYATGGAVLISGANVTLDSSGNFTVPGTIRAGSSNLPIIDVTPGGPKPITVPTVNSIFNYTISAGGGGGGGSFIPAGTGDGGGGGGGGSGQIITGSIFCLANAIRISYTLGSGGAGGAGYFNDASNGADGQDSILIMNTVIEIRASGGKGGQGGNDRIHY